MSTTAMSGSDTVIINNRSLSDFADGDIAVLDYPNDIASVKTGKNGNSLYAINESGRQASLTVRVIRGSDDDKFLNGLIANQQNNFAGFPLMIGELIKRVGDGSGNVSLDTYILGGGIFTKYIPAKSNTDGDVEQSVSVYMLKFSNAPRAIT